jgi:hypothetical protein
MLPQRGNAMKSTDILAAIEAGERLYVDPTSRYDSPFFAEIRNPIVPGMPREGGSAREFDLRVVEPIKGYEADKTYPRVGTTRVVYAKDIRCTEAEMVEKVAAENAENDAYEAVRVAERAAEAEARAALHAEYTARYDEQAVNEATKWDTHGLPLLAAQMKTFDRYVGSSSVLVGAPNVFTVLDARILVLGDEVIDIDAGTRYQHAIVGSEVRAVARYLARVQGGAA